LTGHFSIQEFFMALSIQSTRLVTELDHLRILNFLRRPGVALAAGQGAVIEAVMDAAELICSYDVPATVVTMYSQILIADMPDGEPRKLTLCYPTDAEPTAGFVSVLSPVGSSLIGLSKGELAEWLTPDGRTASARVIDILFQPEESGDYLI
jgi:regulator of nucleoside diphosphate kinase